MSDRAVTEGVPNSPTVDKELQSRRDFLIGLGRWSKIAIGAAILGGMAAGQRDAVAGAWVNHRGGVVVGPGGGVAVGGGGSAWVNNRYGGGAVVHGGGAVVGPGGSAAAGPRGGWVNRRGGGGWVNRRY
jgi:hypothetical protein